MKTLQSISLVAATLTAGLTAGILFSYANSVMPGLRSADDRAFVDIMNRINVVIVNPLFMLCFLGSLGFIALATVLSWRSADRSALPWIIAGLVLYTVALLISFSVNIPLNDQMAKDGADHLKSAAEVREHFESTWVTANAIRVAVHIAAFACLSWALVSHGTDRGPATPRQAAPVHAAQPYYSQR